MSQQLVLFNLHDGTFAVPVESIVEVVRIVAVERLPGSPSWIRGLLNLRGTVLPVVDLRQLIGTPESPLTMDTPIIVARHDDRYVGLLVDSANDMVTVDEKDIDRGAVRPLVGAVVKHNGKLVFSLDLPAIVERAHAGH